MSYLRALLPLALLASSAVASAQRPISEQMALARVSMPEHPRVVVTPLLENDNKLLGLWQLWAEDGNDLGRTHGGVLGVDARLTPTLDLWFEYQTTLFTEQVRDQWGARVRLDDDLVPHPNRRKDRHIHFAEFDYFRVGIHRYLPHVGLVASLGGGLVVRNREFVTLGGTGQQRAWHNFLNIFEPDVKEYRYIDDGGGVRWGGVLSATVGIRRMLWEATRFRVTVDGGAGLFADTLVNGTFMAFHFAFELGLGRRRAFDLPIATFRGAQYIEDYLATGSVLLDTRVQLDFHTKKCDVVIWFDAYNGSPNDAFYVYNFNNTTTTLGFVFRAP